MASDYLIASEKLASDVWNAFATASKLAIVLENAADFSIAFETASDHSFVTKMTLDLSIALQMASDFSIASENNLKPLNYTRKWFLISWFHPNYWPLTSQLHSKMASEYLIASEKLDSDLQLHSKMALDLALALENDIRFVNYIWKLSQVSQLHSTMASDYLIASY
jgi:hypothetical protein